MSRIVDACVFLGRSRYGGELSPAHALSVAETLGVDTVVGVTAVPPDRDLRSATRGLLQLAAVNTGPVRLAVLARIDPWEPDAVASATEALEQGAVGLFLNPWEETFRVNDHPLLDPLMRLLAALGRPVVVEAGHPWVSEPAQLADLAVRHPDVSVVGTRGGHMNMSGLSGQTALRALRAAPNLHVLTSGVYRQDWLADVVAQLGPDRLCYGSLAPLLEPRLEILRPKALPDAEARAAVLGGTASRLFAL
ncbi:amidohydrolase family protein [Pseudonocardia spinosispora]|uniref:amidohydrolase family protein n=1 Tax=Pseudonocardia spinosispora TaxID=103441 RepID=UPI000420DC45|nr:amidohydrolase family protein [Pseudonocardia spinosispora]